MISTRVANSDGWSCSGPRANHRWEPSADDPTGDSTARRATTIPTYRIVASCSHRR